MCGGKHACLLPGCGLRLRGWLRFRMSSMATAAAAAAVLVRYPHYNDPEPATKPAKSNLEAGKKGVVIARTIVFVGFFNGLRYDHFFGGGIQVGWKTASGCARSRTRSWRPCGAPRRSRAGSWQPRYVDSQTNIRNAARQGAAPGAGILVGLFSPFGGSS